MRTAQHTVTSDSGQVRGGRTVMDVPSSRRMVTASNAHDRSAER